MSTNLGTESSAPLSSKINNNVKQTKEDFILDYNCVRHWNRFVCEASNAKLLGFLELYQKRKCDFSLRNSFKTKMHAHYIDSKMKLVSIGERWRDQEPVIIALFLLFLGLSQSFFFKLALAPQRIFNSAFCWIDTAGREKTRQEGRRIHRTVPETHAIFYTENMHSQRCFKLFPSCVFSCVSFYSHLFSTLYTLGIAN